MTAAAPFGAIMSSKPDLPDKPSDPTNLIRVFERSTFQDVFRWVAFAFIILLDAGCIMSTLAHFKMDALFLLRQAIAYILLFACNAFILPTIVLEARKVEVYKDKLIIHNLLYKRTLAWEDIKKVATPMFLKFAILRTPRFVYLINKRDVEHFPDLIQIIRDKTNSS